MAGEWRTQEVADLLREGKLTIGDGYRAKNEELASDGLPFARAGNIKEGFHFEGADRFPRENLPRVGDKVSQPGDVVFTSKGTVGRFAFVRPETPRFVYSPQLCFWRSLDDEVIEPRFLYHWMFGREFFLQFKGVAGQTDMAEYVSLADQRRMRITLPPLSEQRVIAHILGTLDDKIDLLRRMNETLEAIAQAIFKSWFVDFDPVRAKMQGRRPCGMDAATAATLFPDSFEDSPLGKIPKGWRVREIGDVVELAYGKALKDAVRRPGPYPVYGSNGCIGWHDEYLVRGPGIVVGRKGNPGTVSWVPTNFFPIDTTFYVVPKECAIGLHYLFHSLRQEDLASLGADSAVPGLNRTMAYMSELLLPPPRLIAAFERLASALSARSAANDDESRTLAAIRDALLPKLLSGQIRVKGAEKLGGEVTSAG